MASGGKGEAGTRGGQWLLWIVTLTEESTAMAGGSSLDTPLPNCASGSSGAEGTQPRPALLSRFPSDVPWAAQGAQSTPRAGCGSSWGT